MNLSKSTRSVAIPSLGIDQPDCRRAAHASSVGPIDETQLFYLESRGIPPDEARKFIVLGFLDNAFKAFQDIIILFFLAWLLSFALLPLINLVARLMPRAPKAAAVVVVYSALAVLATAFVVQLAASLANSITEFVKTSPQLETQLRIFLRAVEERLATFGFGVELESQAPTIIQNLNQYAQLALMSLSTFKREFKKAFNEVPSQWITKNRLRLAAQLLENTSLSVSDVGFECGFENQTHFSRVFKEKMKVSPLQFRLKLQTPTEPILNK